MQLSFSEFLDKMQKPQEKSRNQKPRGMKQKELLRQVEISGVILDSYVPPGKGDN